MSADAEWSDAVPSREPASARTEPGVPPRRGAYVSGAEAARLHAQAGAGRWGLTAERFHEALERIVAQQFSGETAEPSTVDRFLQSLHLEDLALARGCAEGADAAWEAFVEGCWREAVRAARAIAGETEGEEIADGVLADLFSRGADADGHRRPLFDYFHGRSRLSTWLRALIAQRHVDRLRTTRRLAPLDEEAAAERPAAIDAPDPDRERVVAVFTAALDRALADLPDRDRLRLVCYHGDDLTLAAIGRLLGEHEATVSRKLRQTRDRLRDAVVSALAAELRLGAAEVQQCYEWALAAGALDLGRFRRASSFAAGAARDDGQQDRSAP